MKFDDLNLADQNAVRLAMKYWALHWDSECPTLFGIELGKLNESLNAWPNVEHGGEEATALAIVGSLRELLYGASAVRKEQVQSVIGLSYADADDLFGRLREKAKSFL